MTRNVRVSALGSQNIERRAGKDKAVIKKALVELGSKPFVTLVSKRRQWALGDNYRCPGPLQFDSEHLAGDAAGDIPLGFLTFTLMYELQEARAGALATPAIATVEVRRG